MYKDRVFSNTINFSHNFMKTFSFSVYDISISKISDWIADAHIISVKLYTDLTLPPVSW